jgi:hypothetical protein
MVAGDPIPCESRDTCTCTDACTDDDDDDDDDNNSQSVFRAFSVAANESLDRTLMSLNSNTPQERLLHLLELQRIWNHVVQDRIGGTRVELRDLCISQSPLLSLSNELLMKIALFLDEAALLALEECTAPIYANCNSRQRPCWQAQWQFLDEKRHSRSALQQVNPRRRGVQFAMASWKARVWEERLHKQLQDNVPTRRRRHAPLIVTTCHSQRQKYSRQNFVEDFGYFFQDPAAAGAPPMEFFLRISYKHDNNNASTVLLEGFQSNFESLRHVSDAQDEGFQTYIGFIHERVQAVMVRNDLNRLQHYMGLDERYLQMNSDDSGLESDEEAEFHFLQWPEVARRQFLDRASITLLRCSLSSDPSISPPVIIGSTTGYFESDQHFAIFRPLQIKVEDDEETASDDTNPRDNTTGNDGDEEKISQDDTRDSLLKIGLGCGGGSSLHVVFKWEV